jgi:hypothetical protein
MVRGRIFGNEEKRYAMKKTMDGELAWNLFVELRKETLESQRIRAQVIGFKITFVSACIGFIVTFFDKAFPQNTTPLILWLLPAFAAIAFDFLIISYSFSIKRIGYYCRENIEKCLHQSHRIGAETLLWHEYLAKNASGTRQSFSLIGNMGITLLAVVFAFNGFNNGWDEESLLLATLLVILFAADIYSKIHVHFLKKTF